MPAITSLKSSRTREKRALIREQTEAEVVLQTDLSEDQSELLKLTLAIGKVLLNLQTKLTRLETANDKLLEALEHSEDSEATDQFQSTLDEESDMIDDVISKISQLKVMKEETERKRKELEGPHASVQRITEQVEQPPPSTLASIWSHPSAETPIKPPQLDIPTYDGDILRWQEFWDTFDATIHKGKYSPIDKMNYLKSKLTGEALDAISGYQLSNTNYQVVIDVLKRRFGNTQLIIEAHYRNLSHLPVATNHISKLRQCYDAIECHLRSLEALGENIEHRHFVALITEKLPQRVLYQLYMMKGDEEWTVAKLRELLGKHITAMEMAGGELHPPSQLPFMKSAPKLPYQPREFRNPKTTAGELLVGDGRKQSKGQKNQNALKCVYCGQNHWSDECPKFTTQQARMERLKGSCFKCLQRGHVAKDCRRQRSCFHCGKSSHHRSICSKLFMVNEGEPEMQTISAQGDTVNTKTDGTSIACRNQVLMQTATAAIVKNPGDQPTNVRLILDSGSQRTYITEKLAENLRLTLKPPERLTVATFGSNRPKQISHRPTALHLTFKDGSLMPIEASVVPHITGKISRTPLNPEDIAFIKNEGWEPKLADTLPCETEHGSIEMLIGNDYYFELLLPRKMELGNGLYLFQSKLGWILGGRYPSLDETTMVPSLFVSTVGIAPPSMKISTHMLSNSEPVAINKPNLDGFWNLESIGISDSLLTSDDDQAVEMFNKTVKFDNSRYLVTWPWKESPQLLPENFQLAVGRLKSTLNRLKKDPKLLEMYSAVIQEQLNRGIIQKVTDEVTQGEFRHYIPHHAVITPTKTTTKVRVVYDASAKTRQSNKSLNECLYRGPIMLPDLCGLLLRFRLNAIAIVSDVEKAFLSIGLQQQDRDVTRFLWLKDPKNMNVEGNLEIFRFCRIPFGVVSSPFLLGATIAHHLRQSNNPLASNLLQDMYVDNLVTGAQSISEAKKLYTEAKGLFAKASMNLREWGSNSKQFSKFVMESDRASGIVCKVLGLVWNCEKDTMSIPICSEVKQKIASTKREVLQVTSSIFDPLGYFSPTVLMAKLFIKDLWKEKWEWDVNLSEEKLQGWNSVLEGLECIPKQAITRSIRLLDDDVEYTLVCFSDASSKAYATVVYLHQSSKGSTRADLIFSKTRLAPEHVTIPRLELLGILIGIRALKFVDREVSVTVTSKVLWTDSQCALQWLQSTKPLPVFVNNRLKEIKSLQGTEIRFVPTEDNPADIATRGMTPQELSSSTWWNGPPWLVQPKDKWPVWKLPEKKQTETEATHKVLYEAKLFAGEGPDVEKEGQIIRIGNIIKEDSFSTLHKLLRVTAWLLRLRDKLKKQASEKGPLKASELRRAKMIWDLFIQDRCYSEVIQSVKQGKKNDLVSKLNIVIDDDGVLRCKGRYENADIADNTKYPKLLHKREHYTKLVIEDYHSRFLHSGVSQTLSHTRREYWIPQGRLQVKKLLNQCRVCCRTEGNPFKMPRMPPWPKERVNEAVPFQYTGLDYFGPLYIKEYSDKESTPLVKKVWVCLFTCLVVRAIHLEIVEDMSTEQFLLCLRRFIARCGIPHQIISDNAKQFKLARKVLTKAHKEASLCDEVQDYVANRGIKWTLIVELAPWMGGFYERLVGITKRVLRKTLGANSFTLIQLCTILTEVEAVVNSRPLVYVGDDDSAHVLVPNDFLSMNRNNVVCEEYPEEKDSEYQPTVITSNADKLLRVWKRGQQKIKQFWQLWRNDYLLNLRERVAYLKGPKKQSHNIPQVGDVVLIKENLPRGRWKVGVIHELVQGRDGLIRSAKVLISPRSYLHRALSLLYPIECPRESSTKPSSASDEKDDANVDTLSCCGDKDNANINTSSTNNESETDNIEDDILEVLDSSSIDTTIMRRPTRQATLKAKKKINEWLNPSENFICVGSVAIHIGSREN